MVFGSIKVTLGFVSVVITGSLRQEVIKAIAIKETSSMDFSGFILLV
ncbi:MAG: hypothetical protein IT244_12060 [Bacteroidia bacterium]|nr:hypothetical protein [Bacteroidia bacterium]